MNYIVIYGESDFSVVLQGMRTAKIPYVYDDIVVLIGSGDATMGVLMRRTNQHGWVLGTFKPSNVTGEWAPHPMTLDSIGDSPRGQFMLPTGTEIRCFIDGVEWELNS